MQIYVNFVNRGFGGGMLTILVLSIFLTTEVSEVTQRTQMFFEEELVWLR